jgi:cytochrome c-type biogenesis protein CcmH/NrfG
MDHSIPRRPRTSDTPPAPDGARVAFGGARAAPRDLALAYAIAAPSSRSKTFQQQVRKLLEEAVRHSPNDVEVLLYLAEIYRNNNQADLAVPLYQRAIGLDPEQVTASVGLGGIRMEAGQFSEAIRFWQDALSKNAGLELFGSTWRSHNGVAVI